MGREGGERHRNGANWLNKKVGCQTPESREGRA